MQNHNTSAHLPLAILREQLKFWSEALLDIRRERREIITDARISDPRRSYYLYQNYDLTQAIRERLKEVQQEHSWLIRESAERIAESVAGVMPCATVDYARSVGETGGDE